MKEFMLLICNAYDSKSAFSPEQDTAYLKACEVYIQNLNKNGNLLGAQPLIREGKVISGSGSTWKGDTFSESKEVIVGYCHILAKDLDEAIALVKGKPEFVYTTTARIEVRPIKTKEVTTSYVYPMGV